MPHSCGCSAVRGTYLVHASSLHSTTVCSPESSLVPRERRDAAMPLTVRYIEPRGVRSMPLLEEAGNLAPLQALGVQNLVSAIQQLSSLASHAEGIMGDIVDTLASYHRRGVALEARITILREEVIPKLDPEKEGETESAPACLAAYRARTCVRVYFGD